MASVALPGTNNFVGELLIFFGVFKMNPYVAAVLGLSVIFSVVYMLRFMQKVYFSTPGNRKSTWNDITGVNFLIAAPLIALVLWIGIYPKPVLSIIKGAVEKIEPIETPEHTS
jgi:NADH-quinone oxidoreductase subunit M